MNGIDGILGFWGIAPEQVQKLSSTEGVDALFQLNLAQILSGAQAPPGPEPPPPIPAMAGEGVANREPNAPSHTPDLFPLRSEAAPTFSAAAQPKAFWSLPVETAESAPCSDGFKHEDTDSEKGSSKLELKGPEASIGPMSWASFAFSFAKPLSTPGPVSTDPSVPSEPAQAISAAQPRPLAAAWGIKPTAESPTPSPARIPQGTAPSALVAKRFEPQTVQAADSKLVVGLSEPLSSAQETVSLQDRVGQMLRDLNGDLRLMRGAPTLSETSNRQVMEMSQGVVSDRSAVTSPSPELNALTIRTEESQPLDRSERSQISLSGTAPLPQTQPARSVEDGPEAESLEGEETLESATLELNDTPSGDAPGFETSQERNFREPAQNESSNRVQARNGGMREATTEEIPAAIRQAADRIQLLAAARPREGVVVHLSPEEIGPMTLVVKSVGSIVETQIYAPNEEARQGLEQHRALLGAALESRGLSLQALSVQATSPSGSGMQPGHDRPPFHHQHPLPTPSTGTFASPGRAESERPLPTSVSMASSQGVDLSI